MRTILLLSFLLCAAWASSPALAEADCAAQAVGRGLSGSEAASFLAECQSRTATVGCEGAATEKKLEGKARKAFVKDCAKDTTGK
jgi:hypothetical protein